MPNTIPTDSTEFLTRFTFVSTRQLNPRPLDRQSHMLTARPMKKIRLLVVDDNSTNRLGCHRVNSMLYKYAMIHSEHYIKLYDR